MFPYELELSSMDTYIYKLHRAMLCPALKRCGAPIVAV